MTKKYLSPNLIFSSTLFIICLIRGGITVMHDGCSLCKGFLPDQEHGAQGSGILFVTFALIDLLILVSISVLNVDAPLHRISLFIYQRENILAYGKYTTTWLILCIYSELTLVF